MSNKKKQEHKRETKKQISKRVLANIVKALDEKITNAEAIGYLEIIKADLILNTGCVIIDGRFGEDVGDRKHGK